MTVYAQETACYFTDKNTIASALHTDLHGIDQACIYAGHACVCPSVMIMHRVWWGESPMQDSPVLQCMVVPPVPNNSGNSCNIEQYCSHTDTAD